MFIGQAEQCKNIEINKLFITINNIECKIHTHTHNTQFHVEKSRYLELERFFFTTRVKKFKKNVYGSLKQTEYRHII